MKIRTKNTILFLGLSLVPLVAMGTFAYENGKQAIKNNLGLAYQQLAHTMIKNIDERMGDVYQNIRHWSQMSIMQEIVSEDLDAAIQSFLMETIRENQDFTYISVLNARGMVIASTRPEMAGKNFRDIGLYNNYIKEDNAHVRDVHYSDISKAWEITFSFPIIAEFEKNKVVGTLLAGWKAQALSEMARLYTEAKGGIRSNHFMLMRDDGLVIAAPEFEQSDVFKVNLIKQGLRSASWASRKNKGYLVENDEHGKQSLIGYDYAKGYLDFPDLGWSGFVLSNTDTAFASVERLKAVTFAGGLIVILIVIIFSFLASDRMTTPLMNIAGAADKVAGGDFQARVAISSTDEFGQVAKAFNTMAQDLERTTVSKGYVDSIIANMNNSLFVLSPEGDIKTVNEAACKLLGYQKEELTGQSFEKLLAASEVKKSFTVDPIKTGSSVHNAERLLSDSLGRTIPVLFSSSPMCDTKDNIQGFVCVAQDISERKKKEAEQKRLVTALESIGEGIMITDVNGDIQYANKAFEDITGYKKEEVTGKTPRILKSGQQDNGFYENMWNSLRSGKKWHGVLVNRKKNGMRFDAEETISPVKDDLNVIINFVAVVRDITQRKQTEQELKTAHQGLAEREKVLRNMLANLTKAHEDLKQAQQQLLQSEKLASIGQLAAGVAHEINNPVGFINNNMEILAQYVGDYAKLLKMTDRLTESVARENWAEARSIVAEINKLKEDINLDYVIGDTPKLLEQSREGIERIRKIVMDLRTFAREDKGVMEPVRIEDVIEGILSIVHNEIKYKAKLEKDYGDTPSIECSPQRLGQVFINLIVNALHAIEGSGTIAIKTYTQGEFVCVDVRDTGKGIPPENLSKIFDPFFTTKPVGQGTGLGLSVSYEIIKKHNGEMTVRSKVGEGTTFTIALPINQEKGEKS